MPSVKKSETRNSYLNRAIPMIKKEHPEKSQKAIVGMAEGMYNNKWKEKKK